MMKRLHALSEMFISWYVLILSWLERWSRGKLTKYTPDIRTFPAHPAILEPAYVHRDTTICKSCHHSFLWPVDALSRREKDEYTCFTCGQYMFRDPDPDASLYMSGPVLSIESEETQPRLPVVTPISEQMAVQVWNIPVVQEEKTPERPKFRRSGNLRDFVRDKVIVPETNANGISRLKWADTGKQVKTGEINVIQPPKFRKTG